MFAERMKCPTEYGVASAGSTWTAVTGPFGQLYIWGKPKLTGDTIMYPQVRGCTMTYCNGVKLCKLTEMSRVNLELQLFDYNNSYSLPLFGVTAVLTRAYLSFMS